MKRSICIWLGFAVVLGLTMFPPWIEHQGERQVVNTRLWHARIESQTSVTLELFPLMLTIAGCGLKSP